MINGSLAASWLTPQAVAKRFLVDMHFGVNPASTEC